MKATHFWLLTIAATMLVGWICIPELSKQRLRQHQFPTAESSTPTVRATNPAIGLKLSVLRSGELLANGTEIRLNQLDLKLSMAKCSEYPVGCYIEDGEGGPPPIAPEVINRVSRHRLSIIMSSKPDFSDLDQGPS